MFHSWRKEEIIECIEFHEKENFLGGKKKKKKKYREIPNNISRYRGDEKETRGF